MTRPVHQPSGCLAEPRSGGVLGNSAQRSSLALIRPCFSRQVGMEQLPPQSDTSSISALRSASSGRTIAARAIRTRFCEAPFIHIGVQRVQHAMNDGCKDNGNRSQQCDAALEGVERSEELRTRIGQLPHRPHATEDHAGIEEGTGEALVGEVHVAQHAHRQRHPHQRPCEHEVA